MATAWGLFIRSHIDYLAFYELHSSALKKNRVRPADSIHGESTDGLEVV